MSMNIHHLELFYYVARHGGISEAVRQMPYGIQQPAVSSQIIQLEESLGVTLFQRRPFQLLPPGEALFEFIKPFFDDLGTVAERIRSGGKFEHLRIGAAEIILRDYLPAPLHSLKKKFPSLKVTLRSGHLPQLESWLAKREIDFAVTLLDGKAAGTGTLSTRPLLKLPLMLIVPIGSRLRSADELWQRDRIEEALISLPARETISSSFQAGLARMGVDWFPGIEVSSLDVVEAYVNNGYGLGLTVDVPNRPLPTGLRRLPLPEFPPITLGALWSGKLTSATKAFLDELEVRAEAMGGGKD
jgi:DNA-binding transcriptional LysR family regulator